MSDATRSWDVLLIGGPSGVGKSSVAYAIARRFGIALTEIDDLFIVAETVTTPASHPALHYWRTHPEAPKLPAAAMLDRQIDVCRAMMPAIAPVIANHVETAMPFVLEGDFLTPEAAHSAMQADARTRAVFLVEPGADQILANFLRREPGQGMQGNRAEVSALFGEWLQTECRRLGVPVVAPRPWETVAERVLAATAA